MGNGGTLGNGMDMVVAAAIAAVVIAAVVGGGEYDPHPHPQKKKISVL